MIVHFKKFVLPLCKLDRLWKVDKFVRHGSTQTSSKVLEHLKSKSLLRVKGKETSDFLQGLITNDMKHFEEGAANSYALFLNIKGRVLFDVIVYKSQEDDVYYIECDSQSVDLLQKHLRMYRVRRKVDIDYLGDSINIWALFDPNHHLSSEHSDSNRQKLEGLIFPCGILNNKSSKIVNNIMIYEDPRLSDLGVRILAESSIDRDKIESHLGSDISIFDNTMSYKAFRYKLGIAEGIEDLPLGKPLPLEINCDYLHGVSFHKGCYIGQELTARTYHTGLVRKRLMPLLFDKVPNKSLQYDEKILDESGNVVGKFRGHEKEYGLGLIRIAEGLNAKSLTVSDIKIKISKPTWWPKESEKQSASVNNKK